MSYDVKIDGTVGGKAFRGNASLQDMPGNCGYQVLTYLRICCVGAKVVFTAEERTAICNHVLEKLIKHNRVKHFGKVILSAIVQKPSNINIDTYDFIIENDLLVGTEVTGAHGRYKNISAEFDVKDSKYKAEPYKGLKLNVAVNLNW